MTRGPIRLDVLAPDEYVRDVLPRSHSLWAGARTFEQYAGEFRATAASGWGKRRFRTLGLRVGGELVASCKRYERVLRCGERTYAAAGIGAVFTPEALRGRGYATALLGAFLDAERDAGTDLAYLFSDIRPAFYEGLGFVALPSRTIALRADALPGERVEVVALGDGDAWVVQDLVLAAREPHLRVEPDGPRERSLFVDLSAYTNTTVAPQPSGGAVRASESRIVNILGGGGLAPLLREDILARLMKVPE